jgi:ABC-type amino acid transport substrate-binding protein
VDGRRVGFEVDLIGEIARRLKLRPYFVSTHWEIILQQAQAGRYDCIVGGITITPARQRILLWSAPYMTTTLSLIADGARTPRIRTLADLAGATIAVQAAPPITMRRSQCSTADRSSGSKSIRSTASAGR